jgi:hypothetical protein
VLDSEDDGSEQVRLKYGLLANPLQSGILGTDVFSEPVLVESDATLKGKALPGAFLMASVIGTEFVVPMRAGADGEWTLPLGNVPLPDGQYTVSINYFNGAGTPVSMSTPLTIQKHGAEVKVPEVTEQKTVVYQSMFYDDALERSYSMLALSLFLALLGLLLLAIHAHLTHTVRGHRKAAVA